LNCLLCSAGQRRKLGLLSFGDNRNSSFS
jgi:hypothetical protein